MTFPRKQARLDLGQNFLERIHGYSSLMIICKNKRNWLGCKQRQADIKFDWKMEFINIDDFITRNITRPSQMQK